MTRSTSWHYRIVIITIVAELTISLFLLLAIWSRVMDTTRPTFDSASGAQVELSDVVILGWRSEPAPESLYMMVVMLLGAIGSGIHSLTSLATYVGNRRYRASWNIWYLVRMPVGVTLALLFYLLLRGGLFTVGDQGDVNPFGIGAVAALAGMYAKQATDKLQEVFDTLFRSAPDTGDALRGDKFNALSISQVAPTSVPSGGPDRMVSVFGAGFTDDVAAWIDNEPRECKLAGHDELRITLTDEDVATARRLTLRLARDDRPDRPSLAVVIRVRPHIEQVTQHPDDPQMLSVYGDGFTADSIVLIDGAPRSHQVVDAHMLHVAVDALDRQHADARRLVVRNPAARGGDSSPFRLEAVEGWP